ncbi:MAG: ATP-dependent DNA ligase [Proteobacteria bacterium]|nr:ATP-dependent DNA ligase [Pseudomonadota bacterium]
MNLPVSSPLKPMLAKRAEALPHGADWLYEPKWDGFRVLLFRDDADWLLQSRDLKPLDRYFPELEAPIRAQLPERCVMDGEIVVVSPAGLDFEALSQRMHPAESRVAMLAEKTPASLVLWDVLCVGSDDLRPLPFAERRTHLESLLAEAQPPIHLTPATRDRNTAADWFDRFEGAGLDGVIAKRLDDIYQPNKRSMLKIKHSRTADCVIAGFRWHKNGPGTMVGSLLLGLYDENGALHHVGVAASFTAKRRAELVEELEPLREGAAETHPWLHRNGEMQRIPGGESRWSKGKSLSWQPLRPERVCEVTYDHMEGTRFRHTAHFARWRPDKPAHECTYEQLEVAPPYELSQIFGKGNEAHSK